MKHMPNRSLSRGFTLIEAMVTVAIAGVLSSVAYPSFEGQVMRARRSDAMLALVQAQMAQERYRANHTTYGSFADIGMRTLSSAGRYTLQLTSLTDAGYRIVASANGAQARDADCRHLELAMDGNSLAYASGSDLSLANPATVNRRCWGQ